MTEIDHLERKAKQILLRRLKNELLHGKFLQTPKFKLQSDIPFSYSKNNYRVDSDFFRVKVCEDEVGFWNFQPIISMQLNHNKILSKIKIDQNSTSIENDNSINSQNSQNDKFSQSNYLNLKSDKLIKLCHYYYPPDKPETQIITFRVYKINKFIIEYGEIILTTDSIIYFPRLGQSTYISRVGFSESNYDETDVILQPVRLKDITHLFRKTFLHERAGVELRLRNFTSLIFIFEGNEMKKQFINLITKLETNICTEVISMNSKKKKFNKLWAESQISNL